MRDTASSASSVPRSGTVDLDGPVWFEEWPGPSHRTFVLLHGLGGSHLNWRLVAPGLTRHGRVLVPDLAGFGRTPRAGRPSTVLANRRLVDAFVQARATGSVILCGNSMGGAIALLEASFAPHAVAGVVATSSVLPWGARGLPAPIVGLGFALYRMPIGDWVVRQRFQRIGAERAVALGFRITTADPESIPDGTVAAHVALARERSGDSDAPAAFLDGARSILRLLRLRGPYRTALDRVRCPVLVVHGDRDRFVPSAFARAACRARPSWELNILDGVGHVPQLEAPDRWLAAVERWLSERVPGVTAAAARPAAHSR